MPTVQKLNEEGPEYQSLISYGRQIFQICVGSVLFGTHLAQRSELHDKLTTNQERLERICKTLNISHSGPSIDLRQSTTLLRPLTNTDT